MNPYSDKKIVVRRNDMFIYADIDRDLAKEVVDQLEAMYLSMIQISLSTGLELCPINLHLFSGGGDLMAAFCIIDEISAIQKGLAPTFVPMKVNTYINGEADSAASLIACVGSKRFASNLASSIIHDMSSSVSGTVGGDIITGADNLKKIKELYKMVYIKHSKISSEKFDEMMNAGDKNYVAAELKDMGLVDEIIDAFAA